MERPTEKVKLDLPGCSSQGHRLDKQVGCQHP
jgi:hypothetical protein